MIIKNPYTSCLDNNPASQLFYEETNKSTSAKIVVGPNTQAASEFI